jgi:hypothetical protein
LSSLRVEEPEAYQLRVVIDNLMRLTAADLLKNSVRERPKAMARLRYLHQAEEHRRAGDGGKAFISLLMAIAPKRFKKASGKPKYDLIEIAEFYEDAKKTDGLDSKNALHKTRRNSAAERPR